MVSQLTPNLELRKNVGQSVVLDVAPRRTELRSKHDGHECCGALACGGSNENPGAHQLHRSLRRISDMKFGFGTPLPDNVPQVYQETSIDLVSQAVLSAFSLTSVDTWPQEIRSRSLNQRFNHILNILCGEFELSSITLLKKGKTMSLACKNLQRCNE